MKRDEKINILKGIAEGKNSIYDLQGTIMLYSKDGKVYFGEDGKLGKEVTEDERKKMTCNVLVFPHEFCGL